MSKYKVYSSYKDSGVEWLGEVPESWEVENLKYAIDMIQTGTTPSTKESAYYNGNVNWFNPTDLNSQILTSSTKQVTHKAIQEGACRMFPSDSILIVGIGATAGKTSYLESEDSSFNQQITGFYSKTNYNKYLFYLMKSFSDTLLATANFTTLVILNNDFFKAFTIVVPPIQEQKTIANYLDIATAKIDTLIEKQTRLIALLKEKRQAVISTAVTRGLDSSVPMKDSGVEWLGEIPVGWEVKKLKYLGDAIIGLTYSPANIVDENNGTLVLRSSNLQDGGLYYGDNVYVNSNIPDKLITRDGDIVICSRNGSRKLIGKNAMIDKNSAGVSFGAFTSVFRSNKNPFIFYVLNSSLFKYQSGRFMTTTINQLTTGTLNEFQIALPPKQEQLDIVQYLKTKTSKIDTLITKATKAIDLLGERRTALISAVVTGKVDVRGEIT